MRVGILGSGTLAGALGSRWVRAGHEVVIGARSAVKAQSLAERLGGATRAVPIPEAVVGRDVVLLAVLWAGVENILRAAGAGDGSLRGTPLIDPTNAVDHGVGVLLTEPGGGAADRIADLAPGAHVVKAFHLFPASQWSESATGSATVPICGDDPEALRLTGRLVRDVGATPVVFGSLTRARQLEEVAGFVIGLAFQGADPNSAIPHAPANDSHQ